MKVAVIDVGYNSLKMVKYSIEPDGSAKSYGQLVVMARLGEDLERTGYLSKDAVARTLDTLKICREAATLDGIKHVLLVGTSPVREAVNGGDFPRRVHEQTGMTMRVLAGNEEALYGFLGASRAVGTPDGLYFDLGGGSLEIIYAKDYRVRRILSLPLGALKLTSAFVGKDGTYSRKDRTRMEKRIAQILPSKRELDLDEDVVLVGTGGTVRALARVQQEIDDYPLDKVHNYTIEYGSVQALAREFFRLKPKDLRKIDAVGEDRSQTIAAGAAVVRLMMKRLGFDEMTVSTHGLRDGILAEFLARGSTPKDETVAKEEVEKLATPVGTDGRHEGVSEIARVLSKNGVFDERQADLIVEAMARGQTSAFAEADPETIFASLMSEDLPMDHEDQVFMALTLVRARRTRTANWLSGRYEAVIAENDGKALKAAGACLRLMETLDRSSSRFKLAYSNGLRISIRESDAPFPLELVSLSAQGLSAAIRKPVSVVVSAKEKERQTESLKAGTGNE